MEEEIHLTIKIRKDVVVGSLKTIQERLSPAIMDQSKVDKAMPELVGIVGSDILYSLRGSNSPAWIESGLEEVIREYFKD